MARTIRQPFFLSGEFVARKPFTLDGKGYKPGDDLPHEELGLSERKLRTMYDGHFIMRKPTKEERKMAEASVEAEDKKAVVDKKQAKKDRAAKRRAAKEK